MNKRKLLMLIGIIFMMGILSSRFFIFRFYDKEFEQAIRNHMMGRDIFVAEMGKRETPIGGLIRRRDTEFVKYIFLDLKQYDIKDFRDIKKFKNVEILDISYEGGAGEEKIKAPQNLDAISKLKRLDSLSLFRLEVESESFHTVFKGNVDILIIDKCEVDSLDFIKKIPSINHITLRGSNIPSLEFVKEMPNLKSLHLSHDRYDCSLDVLASAPKLETLSIFDDKTEPFEQIPYIRTVKELSLRDAGSPSKEAVEKYFSWPNLETLNLEDGYYDMKTKIWHYYQEEDKKSE